MEFLERMAGALKILAHPCRLKLVEVLQREGEAPGHVLIARLALPQATLSQHLNQMRRAGLVKANRRGKEVWYSIADPSALTILECIRKKAGPRGIQNPESRIQNPDYKRLAGLGKV